MYVYNKRIYYFKHSVKNTAKLLMKRVEEGSNTEITHSVREEKERSNPVTFMFTEWG